MTIYIASSWKNQHAVEMMTDALRMRGHTVVSFVEARTEKEHGSSSGRFDFDEWVASQEAIDKFLYDTKGATTSDLVVYIGPSGTDAWAEVGAAWASGVEVLGLWAKGEPAGLMRHMVEWHTDYRALVKAIAEMGAKQ